MAQKFDGGKFDESVKKTLTSKKLMNAKVFIQ